jgi:hypothetical protein
MESLRGVGNRFVVEKNPDRRTHFIVVLAFLDTPDKQAKKHPGNGNTG